MTVKDDIIPCASWVAHSYDAIEHLPKRLLFRIPESLLKCHGIILPSATYILWQSKTVQASSIVRHGLAVQPVHIIIYPDFFQLQIGIIWCVFCLLLGSGYYGLMACLVLLTRVSSLRTLDLPSRSDMLWPKQIWRLPQSWSRSPSLDRQTSAGKTTGGLCFTSQESRPNKSFVTAN